jgi:glycine dehydrogenase subunit 1
VSVDLFREIPAKVRLAETLPLPPVLSEPELLAEFSALANKNGPADIFLGAGSYNHFVPSALRQLLNRGEFYTAYTPYQAEASQGTLQAIYEFQSLVCELTKMDAANASMYDGATALAEAALMACRLTGRKEVAVSAAVNPFYRQVLTSYCRAAELKVVELPFASDSGLTTYNLPLNNSSCLILQQPNFFGNLETVSGLAEKVHAAGALFIVSVDPISLALLKGPGEYGADIVVGEGQGLGLPRGFGGPGLGFFAAKKEFLRQLPGRVVGRTVDADGRPGFTLTMATREQHIRREKATSNICSNQALCALAATIYLSLAGKNGLRRVAEDCLQKISYLKKSLPPSLLPFGQASSFKEVAVRTDLPVGLALDKYYPQLAGVRLVCLTELVGKKELDELIKKLAA